MNWYFEPLKKWATFSGRARRMEYWTFHAVNSGVFILLTIVGGFIDTANPVLQSIFPVIFNFLCIYLIATLIPNITLAVRRLHDTDHSGWWILFSAIPFVSIVVLVFLLRDSQPGANQYGENPKETDQSAT